MPLFSSPPHFVAGEGQRQVVFFLNEPVAGALAVRRGPESVDVIVPGSGVGTTIEGKRFADASAAVDELVVLSGPNDATAIRIITEGPAPAVEAQPRDDPPRLIIALGATRARPAARPTPKPVRVAAVDPTAVATSVAEPTADPTAMPTAAPAAPTVVATASPRPASQELPASKGVRVVDALRAQAGTAEAVDTAESADAKALTESDEGEVREPGERTAIMGELPCLWRRWHGVPFCAPDASAPGYAIDREAAEVAASLGMPDRRPRIITSREEPAHAYLWADGVYVTQAPTGRMLKAIQAYRQVLRRHPDFFDAPRARLNIALAYRTMGFESELRAAAEAAAGTPAGTLLRALAGDAALEAGALERARDDFAAVAEQGKLGACLSRRGRIAIAVEGGEDEGAAEAARDLQAFCPPAVLGDPEMQLLLARVRLAAGDLDGAADLLRGLRERVPARSRARVIATQGATAEASGDRDGARAAYEELASGAFGARAAQSAVARLALLDAADGDIESGLRRLGELDSAASGDARRTLVVRALSELDGEASASDIVGLVHETKIDQASLPLEAQVELARAYRTLGLHARAADVLSTARRGAKGPLPAAWFAEAARGAQATGGWSAVRPVADDWLAAHPGSPAAESLRAQALAAAGDGKGAVEALAQAVTRLEAHAVRDLRIEVGLLLRPHDPLTTQGLLEEAATADIMPALEPERAATVLWELGDVAEANGDIETAKVVFGQLVRRYPDAPAATLAAYRQGRLAAGQRSVGAYDQATAARDGLERRAAEAAREFEAIVATLGPAPAADPGSEEMR